MVRLRGLTLNAVQPIHCEHQAEVMLRVVVAALDHLQRQGAPGSVYSTEDCGELQRQPPRQPQQQKRRRLPAKRKPFHWDNLGQYEILKLLALIH